MLQRLGWLRWIWICIITVSITTTAGATVTNPPSSDLSSLSDTGAVEVSQCRTIDEPGRYVLTEDILNSGARECIKIVVSDVIFDGQGHTLDAREVDHKTEAIAAGYTDPPIENITIRNLTVTGWEQGVGCRQIAKDVTIENVTARQNGFEGNSYDNERGGYGIYVGEFTDNVTVKNNIAINNTDGIVIDETNNTVIRDNLVRDNEFNGIFLGPEAWNNRIVENRIISNGGTGVSVGASNASTIRDNVIRGNKIGVVVNHRGIKTSATIAQNQVSGNREGIVIEVTTGDVSVVDNVVRQGDYGIVLTQTNGTEVRNNSIRDVARSGVLIRKDAFGNALADNRVVGAQHGLRTKGQARGTTIQRFVVAESSGPNILLDGEGNNTLVGVEARDGEGIEIKSPRNQWRNLRVIDTQRYGIRLDGADANRFENVTARNTDNSPIQAVDGVEDLRISNLSLSSARISLSGGGMIITSGKSIPAPPEGWDKLDSAVRINHRFKRSTVITFHLDGESTASEELGLWMYDNGWTQIEDISIDPDQRTITGTVTTDQEVLIAPLIASTATPSPTAASETQVGVQTTEELAGTPTAPTSSPVTQSPGQPGFGGLEFIGGLVIVILIQRQRFG